MAGMRITRTLALALVLAAWARTADFGFLELRLPSPGGEAPAPFYLV